MMSGELLELMKKRRTVRRFEDRNVPEEELKKVLESATLPPTGADYLPFTVIAVSSPEKKQSVREAAEAGELAYHSTLTGELKDWFVKKGISHEKPFLTGAPVLLAVASDDTKPYSKESTWIAVAYMLLAIESSGLATVTYTPSDTSFAHHLLKIPDNFSLEVILPVGYSEEKPRPKSERPEGRIFREEYGK